MCVLIFYFTPQNLIFTTFSSIYDLSNKHNKERDFRDRRQERNWDRIDIDDVVNEEVHGKHDWVRIQMTIPRTEQSRRVQFQQEMLTTFSNKIDNFADKDVNLYFKSSPSCRNAYLGVGRIGGQSFGEQNHLNFQKILYAKATSNQSFT
jgi:hypothetical protein